MTASVVIGRTAELTPLIRADFAAIYESSFPKSERDETGALLASIESGARECDLAIGEDGRVLGLAVVKPFSIPGTAALEYLAVEEAARNGGLGARLLGHIKAALLSKAGEDAAGFILEVERPDGAVGDERRIRERRISFYERNGASLIECAPRFRAPTLAGTTSYLLLWLPINPSGVPPVGAELRDLVSALLTESYELDPEEPLVKEVLGDLAC